MMSNKSENRSKGIQGEDEAAKYLQKKGYKILFRNYCVGKLEIDLICRNEKHIVFVEVKKRHSKAYAPPWEAVNKKKQKNIMLAAHVYLKKADTLLEPRFDIVSIIEDGQNVLQIDHFEDAFWPMA
ncbi:MAG: YraN family protein [Flavobacteriales bacterium]